MRLFNAVAHGVAGAALLYVALICLSLLLFDGPLVRGRELPEAMAGGLYGAVIMLGTLGSALIVSGVVALTGHLFRWCFGFAMLLAFTGRFIAWGAFRAALFLVSLSRLLPCKKRLPSVYQFRRP
ncbi:MAG: hypothetical protein Q8Q36_01330 [bacterium]|nr:hypothetical protein [bacterium]